jgi:cytochrome c biogenesis protein CcmG/thiol:disulfide interchange protein DsbE
MSRRRDRELKDLTRRKQKRTVLVAAGSVSAVVGLLGLMALTGGTANGTSSIGGAGGDPALVAGAGLRPCPAPAGNATPVAGGLPEEAFPCLGAGPDLNLASLAGKPMVVNVWGSWCPPCREELPWFAALDDAAAGRLQVIGVDVADTANSALSTLASLGVHYPSIFDPESKTRMSLQWFGGTPVTLLVRADGTIAHRIDGRVPDEATLRALVAEHLGVDVR